MSGTLQDNINVQVTYRGDKWFHDDAERLVLKPVIEAMFEACQKIAEEYSTPDCKVTVV